MSTPTDANRELLTVVASMRAKPGKEQELREALEGLVAPTRDEAGNVSYDLHQGVEDPAVFVFYENWTGPADLQAHMGTPYVQALVARAPELLDGELSLVQLRRIA